MLLCSPGPGPPAWPRVANVQGGGPREANPKGGVAWRAFLEEKGDLTHVKCRRSRNTLAVAAAENVRGAVLFSASQPPAGGGGDFRPPSSHPPRA